MKKLMYIAAALLVLAGCNNKDNALNNAPEGTPFKKGQQVTLTVGTGDNANQAAPRRVAGKDNGTQIDFTWEEGDQILVKVGDKTAVFELSSEPGFAEGEFTGTMPADGNTFDIQYPTTMPDLSTQEYSTEKPIPANKMLFKATGCTLGNDAVLNAQYAMVQINLYSKNIIVGKIVFRNKTAVGVSPLTLTCTGGKQIGLSDMFSTPFYMIVPAGAYQFEIEVYDNVTPAMSCSFATSEAKTFVAGECMNMPAKEVIGHTYVDLGLVSGTKWATMNVGATKLEEYGDYFAWGETEPYYTGLNADGTAQGWKPDKNKGGYAWLSYCSSTEFVEWSIPPYDASTNNLKPEFDAATANWGGDWRMPTTTEIMELTSSCTWEWTDNYNGTKVAGYIVKSNAEGNTNSIFLPAANYFDGESLDKSPIGGCYWSSTIDYDKSKASNIVFISGHKSTTESKRYYGYSVRPVCK